MRAAQGELPGAAGWGSQMLPTQGRATNIGGAHGALQYCLEVAKPQGNAARSLDAAGWKSGRIQGSLGVTTIFLLLGRGCGVSGHPGQGQSQVLRGTGPGCASLGPTQPSLSLSAEPNGRRKLSKQGKAKGSGLLPPVSGSAVCTRTSALGAEP